MKKSILTAFLIATVLGISSPIVNAAKTNPRVNKTSKVKSNNGINFGNKTIKGVNHKTYYVNFRYWGLSDKQEHDNKPASKVIGNLHWVKGIDSSGLLVYKSPHISKSNEIKKVGPTLTNSIVTLANGKGYKPYSLIPVTSIVKYHHTAAFKTFDGVYITANRKQVREVNYYHHKY